ncbi:uracil-DNA glycosylase [Insolitispirillum peregrinum]|uniref:uracil-DNA glycosylase n=1 Tax=Insolitispirillum peregrinum TaxID=80876 RepID=UPI003610CA92
MTFTPPEATCQLCPRLVEFRNDNQRQWPDWHNAPVPSFGSLDASLLVVGLAPGLRGANCTGRPFTGDYAGDLLYPSLKAFGLASGDYQRRPDDGFVLKNTRITNAVRCVPPENKPTPAEQNTCRPFLIDELQAMPNLRVILALGLIAHNAVLSTMKERKVSFPFAHGAQHRLGCGIVLADSYHCSRYNVNTGRLTEEMFHQVLRNISPLLL